MRAAARFNADDSILVKDGIFDHELGVFFRINIVRDYGHVVFIIQFSRQAFDQHRLAGSDRAANAYSYCTFHLKDFLYKLIS